MAEADQVTALLKQWRKGSADAESQLMALVQGELRKLAAGYLRRERGGHTLQPTAVVNEAYLRLMPQRGVQWENRAHFFGIAAKMMRRVLVDHARKKNAAKREGFEGDPVSLSQVPDPAGGHDVDVLSLHAALEALAALDARQAEIVELRFFGGLTIEEVAAAMDVSAATVKREVTTATVWLRHRMRIADVDQAGWQRAKDVIAEALQLPASARAPFLATACPDPELRAEIAVMLSSYEDGTQSSLSSQSHSTSSPVADAPFEFPEGFQAGRYTFAEPLGKGGGGEVYRARDERLHRSVAIKVLPPVPAIDGEQRVREARAAAQLNHRSIASIFDIFDLPSDSNRRCIVMEYVPGKTLSARLGDGRLTQAEVLALGLEIADAVAHAHAAGIVHCDLKPGNIRFAADGSIKVLDFGLARRSAEAPREQMAGLTGTSLHGLALGTPGYMSPEQLLGLPIDRRTDVFSLGVILYEMAAGRRPFNSKDLMSTAIAILASPLPQLPREVPRRLRLVIEKSLSRTADARYASAAELHAALGRSASPWRRVFGAAFRR